MDNEHEMNVLEVGQVLGDRWMILEPIAEGGMAEVYRARQLNLNRDVAIKVMSQRWIESFEDDPEGIKTAVQRFRREVQTMAQVTHSNVIQIYDYGRASVQERGLQAPPDYIVMEYLPDGTLRDTMAEAGAYPQEDAAKAWLRDYFLPVLNGVQALHELGIVHRDLKPENILLDHGVPKIADFGLARFNRAIGVTDSGEILGSLLYVSPEQFVDLQNADERSDIYALGRILYEAMCGTITRKVMPMSSVGLPQSHRPFFQRLDRIVRKATAEKKEERPASVQILRQEIERLANDDEIAATSAGNARSAKAGPWKSVLRLAAASVIAVAVAAGDYPRQSANVPRGASALDAPLRDAPQGDGSLAAADSRGDLTMSQGGETRVCRAPNGPGRDASSSSPLRPALAACQSPPDSFQSACDTPSGADDGR